MSLKSILNKQLFFSVSLLMTLSAHADPKCILAKACAAVAVQTSTSIPIPTIDIRATDKCEISSRLAALKSLQTQQTATLTSLQARQTKELVDTEMLITNYKKEARALEQELARRDFLENPIPPILIMGGACFIGAVMVTGGAAGIAAMQIQSPATGSSTPAAAMEERKREASTRRDKVRDLERALAHCEELEKQLKALTGHDYERD